MKRAPASARSVHLGRGALVLAMMLARVALVSAEPPDLMQTLVAEEATLNNNLTPIEPRWQRNSNGRALALGFGIEKMLSPRLDIEIGGQWDSLSPRDGRSGAAFGNINLDLKYVFLQQPDFQLVIAPQLDFPTNSHIADEPMEPHAGAFLAWGGRLGSSLVERGLPAYLRALEFQGDLGYSHGFGSDRGNEIFFDPVVDYSMPYLGYSSGSRAPWPISNSFVFTELNFDEPLDGTGPRDLSMFATPGLAYLGDTYQLTAGVQLPLTHAAGKNQQMAVLGSLIIFMDRLNPRFAWSPF